MTWLSAGGRTVTVTFAGYGDAGIPDGSTLTFEDAGEIDISREPGRLELKASGAGCPRWEITP